MHGVYGSTRKWKLVLHGCLVTPHYSKAQLVQLVHRISDFIHCDVPLYTQLKVLTSANEHFAALKVTYRMKQQTGLSLPNHVPLCLPS